MEFEPITPLKFPVEKVFVIGDIHGCADELDALLDRLTIDSRDLLVFLGDLVDRGPDSERVLARVRSLGTRSIVLCGNHEDLMVKAHIAGRGTREWCRWADRNGGDATLRSFGGGVPSDVLEWAAGLPLSISVNGLFLVHAGFDPSLPIGKQSRHSQLWIREPFLTSQFDFGALVVHGHSTVPGFVEVRPNRINLDAGCCYGGDLVCGIFRQKQPTDFISASGEPVQRVDWPSSAWRTRLTKRTPSNSVR